jgi:ATP-dependent DNA helicase RecG
MMALSRDQVEVLRLCLTPQPPADLIAALGRSSRPRLRERVLRPLIEAGFLRLTIPDKPRSRLQRYETTAAGRERLELARP